MSNRRTVLRFGAIGVINTALDFGLLFLLSHFGLPVIAANYISTGTALIFSFFANRTYTFKATGSKLHRQLILFFVVTLIGLWVLQPVILLGVDAVLKNSGLSAPAILLVGKLLASVVTLVWNYAFYSRLVFRERPADIPPQVL